MQVPTEHGALRDHLAIARLARWLWVDAGSPPGQFTEFWARAERAIVAAQQSGNNRAITLTETERLGSSPDKNA